MAVNLFLLGVEVYTEFYSHTAHLIHARFQWQAGFGYRNLDGKSSAEASTRLIAEF